MSQGYAWVPSGSSSGIALRWGVIPAGRCDGGNTRYVLPEFPLDSVAVYRSGVRVHPDDFTLSGTDIVLSDAPDSGERIMCDYAVQQ